MTGESEKQQLERFGLVPNIRKPSSRQLEIHMILDAIRAEYCGGAQLTPLQCSPDNTEVQALYDDLVAEYRGLL